MGNEKTVLVIDDDEKLNKLLKEYLVNFGLQVKTAAHPYDGLEMVKEGHPDIVILDVMLPHMDGFQVCREIRAETDIPIIMLTARGEVTDRIVGLELGADDYLPKPFEPRELVARIQSILRRSAEKPARSRIKSGPILLDMNKQTVHIKDKPLDMTTMEFEILSLFIQNPGKLLTRDRIMKKTHDMDWKVFNRTVDVMISRIRQKLNDDPKNPQFIKTVWGSGYKYIGDEVV